MTSGIIRCKVWGLKSLSEDPGEPVCPTLVCAVGILFLFDESIITVPSDDVTTMILERELTKSTYYTLMEMATQDHI